MSAPVLPARLGGQRLRAASAGHPHAPRAQPATGRMRAVSVRQALAAGVVLAVAVVLQPALVGVLPLPLGGPALPTIVLVCLALRIGPAAGCVAGFITGIGADLISDHVIGRLAMVLCVVGYLAGMLRQEAARSVVVPIATVAGAGVLSALLFAATGALVDDSRAGGDSLGRSVVGGAVYAVLLTPFAFPFISWLLRRLRPKAKQ